MGADLHDKCSCGRIKKSYVARCQYCRLAEVHGAQKFPNQGTTGLSTRESKKHRVYVDNAHNRNLGRVGLPYGTKGTVKGKFVCDVCGKQHLGGNIAKGAQKAVGGSIMGIFGTLTMLTGGLTAPLMLGAATAGAALFGAAENYSTCSECRNK